MSGFGSRTNRSHGCRPLGVVERERERRSPSERVRDGLVAAFDLRQRVSGVNRRAE
ncbi:hypothetical protein MAPG_00445 [Magnaporthiopsis poae ATCC 64411]|uniref:Uncharacterized protein n=1 Tax=Magnaporthiopsis poae (strain ATCC 64411 / 73-15) TaxID=644358 RepID=A0A0C4DL11_MAGP6|nr:hypothetical protein MAPG_00445 [Magnaporthiopsis poae ATCC 64411]